MRKQRVVGISIFRFSNKMTMKSSVDISCVDLAIAKFDILYPKRTTEQIGIDLGIPVGYNKALV